MRDPRTDPQVGDVLRSPSWTREVTNAPAGYVAFLEYKVGGAPRKSTCSRAAWGKWAKTAEVVKVVGA